MTTTQRGADSAKHADDFVPASCVTGLQTVAWKTKNCVYAKGGSIVYWGRYFKNSNVGYVWEGPLEAVALSDSDVNWVIPISENGQGRLGGIYADGQADGLEFAGNLKNALIGASQMGVPDPNRLDCFLDIENLYYVSASYWQGWADAVNTSEYPAGSGRRPFYACAYIGSIMTGTGTTNCNTIQNTGGCYGIWSNQPQQSGGCEVACDLPGPNWAPNSCSTLPTLLWQYGDWFVCNSAPCNHATDVDLNLSTPNIIVGPRQDQTDRMIFLRTGDLTPALAAQKNGNQIDVVVRGANGKVYRITRPAPGQAWSGWEELSGLPVDAASNPTAFWRVSAGQLQLEVLVRGVDKSYWRDFFRLGSWSGWVRVADGSDQLQSSPSADGPASAQVHTLYAALGGTSVKQRYLVDGGAWQLYDLGSPVGFKVASNPAGVWWNNDQKYEIFVRGTDNKIYNKEWNSVSGWDPNWYTSAGVSSQVQPTATARGVSELYVFFIPPGGTTIQYRGFNIDLGWFAVADLGAPTSSGVVSAAGAGWSQSGIHLDVATRGSDNYLYVNAYDGAWVGWRQVALYPGLSP
jgi:hypothetical protein